MIGAIDKFPANDERPTHPPVTIIVLNWRSPEVTRRCLQSISKIDYPNYNLVVVDNESTTETAAVLAKSPNITLITSETNRGFAGGVNIGIDWAMKNGAQYIWLLNNDAITPENTLSALVEAAEIDPCVGLVCPTLYDPVNPEGPSPSFVFAETLSDGIDDAATEKSTLLYGTALLIKAALVERIGLFDERFFAYIEDLDYSTRSLRAGFKNICVSAAIVYHPEKHPVEDPDSCQPYIYYYSTRNSLLLWKKASWRLFFRREALWFLRARMAQVERSRHNQAAVDAQLAGLWDGVWGSYGAYDPERRMPLPLRWLLGRYPTFWLALLDRRLPWRTPSIQSFP